MVRALAQTARGVDWSPPVLHFSLLWVVCENIYYLLMLDFDVASTKSTHAHMQHVYAHIFVSYCT